MCPTNRVSIGIQGPYSEPKTLSLRRGLGLQALESRWPDLEFDCRQADCGICIIRVRQGLDQLSPPTKREADFLQAMRAESDERLACQCRVFGDVELSIDPYD
jgi:ferredoxin